MDCRLYTGLFLAKPLAGYLSDGVLGAMVSDSISGKLHTSAGSVETTLDGLPEILGGGVFYDVNSVSELLIDLLSSMVITVASFTIIVLVVKFILGLLVRPACRRMGRGVINAADRVLGCIAGLVKGLVMVFVMLAVLMVLVNIAGSGVSGLIVDSLENSLMIKTLYDNNMLLLVTGGFFG